MIANFQWAVSKPGIWICFSRRFVEGCGEGDSFYFVYCNQYIDWLQVSYSIYSSVVFGSYVLAQVTQRSIGLIPHDYFVSDIKISTKRHIFVVVYVLIIFQL